MNATVALKNKQQDAVNAYIGMTIIIGAFCMFFGSLFVSYLVLRLRQAQWPPPGYPAFPSGTGLSLVSTIVLLVSSLFLHIGIKRLDASNNQGFKTFLGLGIITGFLFLGLQVLLWKEVNSLGIYMNSGAVGAIFYGLTLIHAAHIVAGLIALLILLPGAFSGAYLEKGSTRVRLTVVFWHFLDIMWIIIYLGIFVF